MAGIGNGATWLTAPESNIFVIDFEGSTLEPQQRDACCDVRYHEGDRKVLNADGSLILRHSQARR
jgi:hypothetical protein